MDVRAEFPLLQNNKGLIYLDTSASAQKPFSVLQAMDKAYRETYSNVHRSAHHLAECATRSYEASRSQIAQLINAQPEELFFTSGTTDGLNKISRALCQNLERGDEIVITIMEHHSNFVPWQQLAVYYGLQLKIIPLTPEYRLDLAQAENLITEKTKVFAFSHVSNMLGTSNPVKELVAIARNKSPDIQIVVDGAQAVAHMEVDVKDLDVDFYCFSGHKMYGPTGIGAVYGKQLSSLQPVVWGGEMVADVRVEKTTFAEPPARFEAGTPNIIGAIGMGAAAKWLLTIGYESIVQYEEELVQYTLSRLAEIEGLSLIGPRDQRIGAFSFLLESWHPHDLSDVLNAQNIAVRAGHHCTQPLHCALGLEFERDIGEGMEPATTRASLGIYNTKEDIDCLIEGITVAKNQLSEDAEEFLSGDLTEGQQLVKMHIMDHVSNPRNKRIIEYPDATCSGKNPNCGDTVKIYLRVEQDSIKELSFEGVGCAISQASSSMLTKKLEGKPLSEVQNLDLSFMNDLIGLDFSQKPVRAKCAMLGLRTIQCAIQRWNNET